MFESVRDHLAPAVGDLIAQSNLDPLARRSAADTLADYGRDKGTVVAEALLQSEPSIFEALFPVAVKNADEVITRLEQELAQPIPSQATEEDLEKVNIRKSRAAAGLARLEEENPRLEKENKVCPLLVFDPQPEDEQSQDPSLRTEVLHALAEYRAFTKPMVNRLVTGLQAAQQMPRNSRETSIQRAMLLALGEFTGGMSNEDRQSMIQTLQLQRVFENDPDPGIHSACELLLRRWGEQAWLKTTQEKLTRQALRPAAPKVGAPRRWFVDRQGQTFVVFPPGVFSMGSLTEESGRFDDEPQHRRQIERSFAIATTEVTRAQYAEFAAAEGIEPRDTPYFKTSEDPQTRLTWYEAVRYCNWLSGKEKLTACYQIDVTGKRVTVIMKPKFLELDGYRLPTEAEWEYACRAGVAMAWPHGRTERRLGQYTWHLRTSDLHLWPVGRLLPNEAGLFDMSGNGSEWCQDALKPYPRQPGEHPTLLDDAIDVNAETSRVLRGGSFSSTPSSVRAANRGSDVPKGFPNSTSFRVSRTYLPPQ
jgi:formylglycine-generating enzyme required for sulfatase activity